MSKWLTWCLLIAIACGVGGRAAAQEIGVALNATQRPNGVQLRAEDGESLAKPVSIGSLYGWKSMKTVPASPDVRYLYFVVTDAGFKGGRAPQVSIELEYLDEGQGVAELYYDSSDAAVKVAPESPGAWKRAGQFELHNTRQWLRQQFQIGDARFDGRCNGADLRLNTAAAATPIIRALTIRKGLAPRAAATPLAAAQPRRPYPKTTTRREGITRICVSEKYGEYGGAPENCITRFECYQSIGVDAVRIANFDGWVEHPELLAALKKVPLRIKYILYSLPIQPDYTAKYPDEVMIDNRGLRDWHLGPWNADFRAAATKTARAAMQTIVDAGLVDRVDEVCVDLGPAGEGIYPANWTLNKEGEEGFWCYSKGAQADFRKAMQAKYGTVAAANQAWGLAGARAFANWEAVAIPQPKTPWARGAFWNDMLIWYRDSKRRMMLTQIEIAQQLVKEYLRPGVKCIVYLPGAMFEQREWDQAVAEASGGPYIRLMVDNDWLMAKAIELGCVLQYTGVENAGEIRKIVAKLKASGSDAYKTMWGENAGYEPTVRRPYNLASIIVRNDLRGIDLTFSNWLFEEDGVTPNATCDDFAHAIDVIRTYHASGKILPDRPSPGQVVRTAPGVWTLKASADTRIMGAFPQETKGGEDTTAVVEGGQSQRILLRFPLEELPRDFTIGKATLVLHRTLDWGDTVAATLGVYRLTQPWSEIEASWTTAEMSLPWQQAGGSFIGTNAAAFGGVGQPYATAAMGPALGSVAPGGGGYPRMLAPDALRFDVTQLARELRGGPNHGMLIKLTGTNGNKTFATRESVDPELRPTLILQAAAPAGAAR